MREFVGKAAFVTGGASGIGLALGRAFAEAGCKVMLADIEKRRWTRRWRASQAPGERYGESCATLPIPLPSTPLPKQPFLPSAKSTSCGATPGLVLREASTFRARQLALASGCESKRRRQWGASFPAAHTSAW